MTDEPARLPDNFVSSLEYVEPKEIVAELQAGAEERKEATTARPFTMWALKNELRPSDLYCYLGARFGKPNGIQNFLRQDSTDNLVHWEWYLKTSAGRITIAGLNFRTDVWIMGMELPDTEKTAFAKQVKADFANYQKEMEHLRAEHLELWVEFVNPYQRLRRAVKQQIEELDKLKLDPSGDSLPSVLESEDQEAATKQWRDKAEDYTKATAMSFGIRAMVPVMAEAFVNLILFALLRPSIRKDKTLRTGVLRLPMHVRIRSLPYYCSGFKAAVDSSHPAIQKYTQLIGTRNDLLHGNIDVERLKFNELYFYGNVPIFNRYTTMWERSLGVAHRAVGLEEVRSELAVVDAFVEYLIGLLDDKTSELMKIVSEKFDLGVTKETGRIGVLFSDTLVDFGFPKDQPPASEKTLKLAMILDKHPDGKDAIPPTDKEIVDGSS